MKRADIKKLFEEELKKGTGKAQFLFKRHFREIDFSKQLIEVCIHNPDYDPQCSGGRAVYLYEMIKLLPDHVKVENLILKRFLKTYWCSVEQLFDLTVLFAKNGNENARSVIYKKFKDELGSPDGAGAGSHQIVELDGISGLLFVAEHRGKQLRKFKDDWEPHTLLEDAQKAHPRRNIRYILNKAAKSSQNIRTYLKAVEESDRLWKDKSKKRRLNYKQIKRIIDSGGKVPTIWGFKATPTELNAAAYDFIKEKNNKKIVQYLRIFYKGSFPLALDYLLDWKRYKTKETKMWALNALSNLKNEAVRQLAIKHLNERKMISHSMTLFEKNFRDSDTPLIEKILWKESNPYEFHGAAMSVIDICRSKRLKNPKRLLEPVYKRGYCAGCRERALNVMRKRKILPTWIKKEAMCDCNLYTRKMIARITNKK